ncbi:MAG: hypothetical protein BJ554DRAFT_5229, partial [Olpidium bornovanus]
MAKKNLHVKRCHTQLQPVAGFDAAASPTAAENPVGQATGSFDALLLRRARVAADQSAARAESASRSPQLQTARRPPEVDVLGPGNGIDHLLADFHLAGPKSAPAADNRNILLSEMRSLSTSPVAGTSSSVGPAAAQLPLSPLSIFAAFPSLSGAANGSRSPLAATTTTSPLSPGLTGSSALVGQTAFAGTTPRATTVLDQNPPCNTVYVGNLSSNTSEEELRRMFSVCPGYKRMSFKVKANGPLCFVEFEDVGFATQGATSPAPGSFLSADVLRFFYFLSFFGLKLLFVMGGAAPGSLAKAARLPVVDLGEGRHPAVILQKPTGRAGAETDVERIHEQDVPERSGRPRERAGGDQFFSVPRPRLHNERAVAVRAPRKLDQHAERAHRRQQPRLRFVVVGGRRGARERDGPGSRRAGGQRRRCRQVAGVGNVAGVRSSKRGGAVTAAATPHGHTKPRQRRRRRK